eukprot:scaffold7351_cov259-Pinguiococcus_pyrenoidosus.AAC.15
MMRAALSNRDDSAKSTQCPTSAVETPEKRTTLEFAPPTPILKAKRGFTAAMGETHGSPKRPRGQLATQRPGCVRIDLRSTEAAQTSSPGALRTESVQPKFNGIRLGEDLFPQRSSEFKSRCAPVDHGSTALLENPREAPHEQSERTATPNRDALKTEARKQMVNAMQQASLQLSAHSQDVNAAHRQPPRHPGSLERHAEPSEKVRKQEMHWKPLSPSNVPDGQILATRERRESEMHRAKSDDLQADALRGSAEQRSAALEVTYRASATDESAARYDKQIVAMAKIDHSPVRSNSASALQKPPQVGVDLRPHAAGSNIATKLAIAEPTLAPASERANPDRAKSSPSVQLLQQLRKKPGRDTEHNQLDECAPEESGQEMVHSNHLNCTLEGIESERQGKATARCAQHALMSKPSTALPRGETSFEEGGDEPDSRCAEREGKAADQADGKAPMVLPEATQERNDRFGNRHDNDATQNRPALDMEGRDGNPASAFEVLVRMESSVQTGNAMLDGDTKAEEIAVLGEAEVEEPVSAGPAQSLGATVSNMETSDSVKLPEGDVQGIEEAQLGEVETTHTAETAESAETSVASAPPQPRESNSLEIQKLLRAVDRLQSVMTRSGEDGPSSRAVASQRDLSEMEAQAKSICSEVEGSIQEKQKALMQFVETAKENVTESLRQKCRRERRSVDDILGDEFRENIAVQAIATLMKEKQEEELREIQQTLQDELAAHKANIEQELRRELEMANALELQDVETLREELMKLQSASLPRSEGHGSRGRQQAHTVSPEATAASQYHTPTQPAQPAGVRRGRFRPPSRV